MNAFNFYSMRNQGFDFAGQTLQVNGQAVRRDEQLDCGECGIVSGEALIIAARRYYELTGGACKPQLAALVFDVTGDLRALDHYFAITNLLRGNEAARLDFYAGIRYVVGHPNLDLRIYGERVTDVGGATPPAVRHLVAGQLVEVFFQRRDILEKFLSQPRHFQVYTSRAAFEQDDGLAGGDYRFDRQSIQLEMSRLFEGFYNQNPGVCPFLHELGHMLDHFDASSGGMGQVEGLLPGMSPADGPFFTPLARQLFIQGKTLEKERYQRYQDGQAGSNDPIPVGHPYVFQTDGEFIAGYFEMFFRNPNYFASQNPVLYDSFGTLLQQDPRQYWPVDFPGYVGENRKAYLGGQRPSPQNISVPQDSW